MKSGLEDADSDLLLATEAIEALFRGGDPDDVHAGAALIARLVVGLGK
jgi:hypothetical protein